MRALDQCTRFKNLLAEALVAIPAMGIFLGVVFLKRSANSPHPKTHNGIACMEAPESLTMTNDSVNAVQVAIPIREVRFWTFF